MDQDKYELIKIALTNVDKDKAARHLLERNYALAVAIVEDWLKTDLWGKLYGSLSENRDEGHMSGPSPAQERTLKRMRDTGDKISSVRGNFRWLDNPDEHNYPLSRIVVRIMLENGWIEMLPPDREGVEYVLFITDKGRFALANTELDPSERSYFP